jgi:hypothetical protein
MCSSTLVHEGSKAAFANDDVVEDADPDELAGLAQAENRARFVFGSR